MPMRCLMKLQAGCIGIYAPFRPYSRWIDRGKEDRDMISMHVCVCGFGFSSVEISSMALVTRFEPGIISHCLSKWFCTKKAFLYKVLNYEDESFALSMSALDSHSLRTTGLLSQ